MANTKDTKKKIQAEKDVLARKQAQTVKKLLTTMEEKLTGQEAKATLGDYPTDVNQTAFNRAINYSATAWTPSALAILKTEAFGFTLGRDLNKSEESIDFGEALGFAATQRSHLIGVGDAKTAWVKEAQIALGKGEESVVLFALDQFCLIGYDPALPESLRRSVRIGS